jgi:proteic killer suppression protein
VTIKSFADARTAALYNGEVTKGTPTDLARRAQRKLRQLDAATRIADMRVPPSNFLEKLSGKREGQWIVRVSRQWRITFVWRDGNPWEVWFGDYHDE